MSELDDWIDLHGFAPRDVTSVVREYLDAAARQGLLQVRLVHGRGKGVQRRNVQELLARHPLVAGFRDAPNNLGATLVWLRRIDESGRTRWRWHARREHEHEWRALLECAIVRADRLCLRARERGPRVLSFGAPFPFVHARRAPGADEVFDKLGVAFERTVTTGVKTAVWSLTDDVRDYLLERSFDAWDQCRGMPEDPTLLEGSLPVLVASSRDREAVVHLDERERDEIAIDLEPM